MALMMSSQCVYLLATAPVHNYRPKLVVPLDQFKQSRVDARRATLIAVAAVIGRRCAFEAESISANAYRLPN